MVEVEDVSVRQWHRRVFAAAVVGACGGGLMVEVGRGGMSVPELLRSGSRGSGSAKDVVDLGSVDVRSSSYGSPSSVRGRHYPFNETIVEPFKSTTLAVSGGSGSGRVTWRVSDGASGEEELSWSDRGSETSYTFTTAGRALEVSALDAWGNSAASHRVLCKYVRREVRSLTSDDRAAFVKAVSTVYSTPTVEGQRVYGKDFRNGMSWFARWHLGSASAESPWHGGPSFFTSHAIFAEYFERALQAVDPSVALHYWDFTKDAQLDDWTTSEMWSSEYFGPVGRGADSPVVHGAWANVSSPQGLLGTTTNSYGILNEPYNNNKEQRLTRTFELCGLASRAFKLPGCSQLKGAMANKAMDQGARPFETAIQIDVHFELHPLLGGAWDCAVNAQDFVDDERARGDGRNATVAYVDAVSAVVRDLASFVLMNFYTTKLSCPEACDATSTDACKCSCVGADLDAPMDDAQWYSLFVKHVADVMYDIPQPQIVMPFTYELLETTADGTYVFRNLTDAQNDRLYEFFVKQVCAPPSFSNFASALASAGDPIFFPVHANYERVWTYLRLDRGFNSYWNVSGMSQTENAIVTGYRYDDPLEPFTEAYGNTREPPGSFYTNREIIDLFDPKKATLPYIYEDLDWAHCD